MRTWPFGCQFGDPEAFRLRELDVEFLLRVGEDVLRMGAVQFQGSLSADYRHRRELRQNRTALIGMDGCLGRLENLGLHRPASRLRDPAEFA